MSAKSEERGTVVLVRYLVSLFVLISACAGWASVEATDRAVVKELAAAPTTNTREEVPPVEIDASTTTAAPAPSTTVIPATSTTSPLDEYGRPRWLGTVPLDLDENGFGLVAPTPPELESRAFGSIDVLGVPLGGFEATVGPVPNDVLARSTWHDECPVPVKDLSYLTVVYFGFDGLPHFGELIVHESVAEEFVVLFRSLYENEYPIEEMRVVSQADLAAHPTGDGNNTTSFVCRPATGSTSWSQHAYGLAIDINPFHNPYLKGDLVLPELATYFVDRSRVEPGQIMAGDAVVEGFASIGWTWGGDWNTLKDWMHFSRSGN